MPTQTLLLTDIPVRDATHVEVHLKVLAKPMLTNHVQLYRLAIHTDHLHAAMKSCLIGQAASS